MNTDQMQFKTEELGNKNTADPSVIGISTEEGFSVSTRFDELGFWRAELESGLVYWTESVFRIYGLEPTEGPVNIGYALASYHPDDRDVVLKCLEDASRNKSGFRFVLRFLRHDGEIVWVKSQGLFRVNKDGKEEIYGDIVKIAPLTRSVTILK